MAIGLRNFPSTDAVRDNLSISNTRQLKDGSTTKYQISYTMELAYHFDVRTNSTGGSDVFNAFFLQKTITDPVLSVGSNLAGNPVNVKYTGTWNVASIDADDQNNSVTRVTVQLYKTSEFEDEPETDTTVVT